MICIVSGEKRLLNNDDNPFTADYLDVSTGRDIVCDMKKTYLLISTVPVCGMIVAVFALCCSSPGRKFSEQHWREQVEKTSAEALFAPHKKDGRYFNPWMPMEEKGLISVLGWKMTSGREYSEYEKNYRPAIHPDPLRRIQQAGDADFILWIGHNSFLIRVNGEYWLTDPIFSARALLPKRKVPPGMTPGDIEKLGGTIHLLISHNHYDHLDEDSIRGLPAGTKAYVPSGLKDYIRSLGIKDVVELDWWQKTVTAKGTTLTALPAQHWSRRITQGTNSTLWASFMLESPGVNIYCGGDSGYFVGYREFGRIFKKIDYALLPTTAYHPRWFMHYPHMDVDEALRAFSELGAKYFVPTQWGTFALGDEPVGYPAIELKRKIQGGNLDPARYKISGIGEILVISGQ